MLLGNNLKSVFLIKEVIIPKTKQKIICPTTPKYKIEK